MAIVKNERLMKRVQAINDFLREANDSGAGWVGKNVWTIRGPIGLAVVARGVGERYSTHNFMGGEKFILAGVYLGKRGEIIYRFKASAAGNFSVMECPESKLEIALSTTEIFKDSLNMRTETFHAEELNKPSGTFMPSEIIQQRKAIPEYGTW
jgi:hypothetical protein